MAALAGGVVTARLCPARSRRRRTAALHRDLAWLVQLSTRLGELLAAERLHALTHPELSADYAAAAGRCAGSLMAAGLDVHDGIERDREGRS